MNGSDSSDFGAGHDEEPVDLSMLGLASLEIDTPLNRRIEAAQIVLALAMCIVEDVSPEVEQDAGLLGIGRMGSLGAETIIEASTYMPASDQSVETNISRKRELWTEVQRSGSPEAAILLAAMHLTSEHESLRVASACMLAAVTVGDTSPLRRILMDGVYSGSPTTARVAMIGLRNLGISPQLAPPTLEGLPHGEGSSFPSQVVAGLSTTIHGSFARHAEEAWYRPSDPLHTYIRDHASSNLDSSEHYFRWGGTVLDEDRRQAGRDLRLWYEQRGLDRLDVVYAHSHGGNVMLDALAQGAKANMLILMHTPPNSRPVEEWNAIRSNVLRTVCMRTRADWVVVADSIYDGRLPEEQRRRVKNLKTNFDHSYLPHGVITPRLLDLKGMASHSFFIKVPSWEKYRLEEDVRYEYHSYCT